MSTSDPFSRPRAVTSVAVARAAGVSQATVSRVLNDKPVSQHSRRRVLAAMKQLDYHPDPIARSMVTRRTGVIGVVVSDVTNLFNPEMLETVNAHLSAAKLGMLLINAGGLVADHDLAGLLLNTRVDGAILTTALHESPSIHQLVAQRFPIVFAYRAGDPAYDCVVSDNRTGGELAARHLLDLGHRRLGMVRGQPGASTAIERADGFEAALAAAGAPLAARLTVSTNAVEDRYERAYLGMRALLTAPDRPTAVFCHNDWTAFAVLNAARAEGVDVPGALSVIGFDDVRMAAWESFGLTTIRQLTAETAREAVELLLSRIHDPTRAPRRVTMPCELVVRRTTAPPPADS